MMHHNFFYGVVRERDGVRERCLLWRKVWGTPSQTEEQEAYRDGVPILGQQLERRFITELQEHFKCVIWRTAWKVSTSSSSCTRTKCSSAAEMSSASWCTV